MADWPSTLPDTVISDAYQETPPDNLLRTPMDKGPAKLRRRTTTNVRNITCRDIYTTEQVATLDTFYVTTLQSGALAFDWEHPRTGSSVEMRFAARPTYTALSGRKYQVDYQLEIMP